MRRFGTWLLFIVAMIVTLGSAYGAYTLAGYSWSQVVDYRSPFADYDRPWINESGPAIRGGSASAEDTVTPESRRVVLVIIDGLRMDASTTMTSLDILRGYGADMAATTPQPSLSFPTWTTILSGAPPQISGVPTNWFENPVPVETLFDTSLAAGKTVVVSAPDDFSMLYEAERADGSYFESWKEDEYMSTRMVDNAISLVAEHDPELLVVHLPDADEAGHQYGSDSDEYRSTVGQIDADLSRLVQALQDDRTAFVICADHGHIPTGGHGGWERDVTVVPAIFTGAGVRLNSGSIDQIDIAPTVAALLDIDIPRNAMGRVRGEVLLAGEEYAEEFGSAHYSAFAEEYVATLGGTTGFSIKSSTDARAAIDAMTQEREDSDRNDRLAMALALVGAALGALVVLGLGSWRALVAASAGTAAYYAIYNGLYFVFHGHQWSLSAFNSEDLVEAFFNLRMIEATVAAVLGVIVAGVVYPYLRRHPQGPRQGFLGGWLALGTATVLTMQATLAFQVAWFLWRYGAEISWRLPNLKWGFKYDLDLIQMTGLGAAVLVAPLVTYLVGRYHPRVRRATE